MSCRVNKKQGFTLIEILVVLLIISIVTGSALLTVGRNDKRQVGVFADELLQTIALAEEQAIFNRETIGIFIQDHSVIFAQQQINEKKPSETSWIPLPPTSMLGRKIIPDNMQVHARIANLKAEKDDFPQIIISTNGDTNPFELLLGLKGKKATYAIIGTANGNLISEARD